MENNKPSYLLNLPLVRSLLFAYSQPQPNIYQMSKRLNTGLKISLGKNGTEMLTYLYKSPLQTGTPA